MGYNNGIDGKELLAEISKMIDAAANQYHEAGEDAGEEFVQGVVDGIKKHSKEAKSEMTKLFEDFNKTTNRFKSKQSVTNADWTRVLGLSKELMKSERYADNVREKLAGISVTFKNGVNVSGLEKVLEEFEKVGSLVESVQWSEVGKNYKKKPSTKKTAEKKPKTETPAVQADPAPVVKSEEKKQEAIQETTDAIEAQGEAIDKVAKQMPKMESVIKRYNKLMSGLGLEHLTIGERLSEDTEGWGIKEMVEEAKYQLSTFYDQNSSENVFMGKDEMTDSVRKRMMSDIGKLKRFITAYEPYIDVITTTVGDVQQATTVIEEQTTALHEQASAAESTAEAQEKLNNARQKSSRIKVREFTREEHDAHTEQYQAEHDGEIENLEETVDIIRQASQFGTKFEADMITACKRATTAVKRFFEAIDPEKYPGLAGWKDGVLESVQNGYFSEKSMLNNGLFTGEYVWGVEENDGRFYVYLNLLDVAKDKESEFSAHIEEESKKRDDAVSKEVELYAALRKAYEKLSDLRKNEPEWDNTDQIKSYEQRIAYYEKEKALMQEILGLKEEFQSIPGKYRDRKTSEVNQIGSLNGTEEVTSASLEETDRIIAFDKKELIRVTEKQTQALREQKDIQEAIQKLNELNTDPYDIKDESEVNRIYQERLVIIKRIGEEKFKAYNEDEYEGALNVNKEYESRLTGFAEARDNDVYDEIWDRAFYDNEQIQSAQELEELLEKRLGLLQKISLTDTDLYRDELEENKLIEDRIALMKKLEPLAANGAISKNDLEEIVFENGTLGERIDTLNAIQMNAGKAFDENWDDALQDAQMFLDTYEKILVTTASGKKLELGPDMSMEDYRAFLRMGTESAKSVEFVRKQTQALHEQEAAVEGVIKDQEDAAENVAQTVRQQNQIVISSYQDLYKALEKVVELSKQLKPEWTAEYSDMYAVMDKAGYPDSKEDLIANIKAQYDNIQRIKASIKNGLPVYKDIDGSGYEATLGIDKNTLKDAENMLTGYIYQAIEYFGYTVADAMNDFSKKRIRTLVEKTMNQYLAASSTNDEYQAGAEEFNAPIKDAIESITDRIMDMTKDTKKINAVSDHLSELQNRPEDVNRYTLSSQANYIGSTIGLNTPYDEIQANAKKIESYEDLCEVVSKYNELQKGAIIFGGSEHPGLDEAGEMERQRLAARLKATGGKDIYKLSGIDGFDNIDNLAKALGIAIPKIIEAVSATESRSKALHEQKNEIAADQSKKSLKDFMSKWNELSSQSDDKEAFGRRHASLLEGVSGESPSIDYDTAYNQLIADEDKYQQKVEETKRINTERSKQLQEFVEASQSMFSEELTLEESAIMTDILNKISLEGMSAADAIEELSNALKALRGQQNTIDENIVGSDLQDTFDVAREEIEKTSDTAEQSKKSLQDFLDLFNKMSAESGDIDGFDKRHKALIDKASDLNSNADYDQMYDQLIADENRYQQLLKEREAQGDAYTEAAIQLMGVYGDSVSFQDKEKLFTQFLDKVVIDGMSASDAMDQLYLSMEALRKQSEAMPDSVVSGWEADVQKLEAYVNNLGEEFKNSEQYRDNFNILVDGIKSGSIDAAKAIDTMSNAYINWADSSVGDGLDEFKAIAEIVADMKDSRVANAFNGMNIKDFVEQNVKPDARDQLEGELYKLAQTIVDQNDVAYKQQLDYIADFVVANFKAREPKEPHPYDKEFRELDTITYTDEDAAAMGEQLFEDAKRILGRKLQKKTEKNKHADSIDQFIKGLIANGQASLFSDPNGQESDYNKFREFLDQYDNWKQEGTRKTRDTYLSDTDAPKFAEIFNETMRDQMVNNINKQQEILDQKTKAAKEATDVLNRTFEKVKQASSRAVLKGKTKEDFENFANQVAKDSGMDLGQVTVARDSANKMTLATIKLINKELAQSITYTYDLQENADGIEEATLRSSYAVGDASKALENLKNKEAKAAKKVMQDDTWLYGQRGKLDTQQRRYTSPDRGVDGKLSIMSTETSLADDAEHTIESLANHIRDNIKKSLGGKLTDEVKRQIVSDLEILENEIKVRQQETYSSTTMKSSQVETNKKAYTEYMRAFEARAKKSGVFPQMAKTITDLNAELGKVSDASGFSKFVDNFKVARNKLQAEIAELSEDTKMLRNQLSTFSSEEKAYNKIFANIRAIGEDNIGDSFAQKILAYQNQTVKLRTAMDNLKANPEDADYSLHKAFDDAALSAQRARKEIEDILKQSQNLEKISQGTLIGTKDLDSSELDNLRTSMISFAASLEDGEFKFKGFNKAGTEMYGVLDNGSGALRNITVALNGASDQLYAYSTTTEKASNEWDDFTTQLVNGAKNIAGMYVGFQEAVQAVRSGAEYVKEIDLAMTELKKVTDETDASYKQFLEDAGSTSAVIGSTISDFTNASATFARLGYSLDEASSMAETAIVYKNVADGLDSVEESSESIISTMMAFGIEASDTMSIIDKFNAVGNSFAITSAGIGDALQRSASALFSAGNTIDESVALVTAANSVIQNPEQVGTALKTLALRLRGAKVELEEAGLETDNMAESTSTLQAKLNALTHGKVDIMLDADTFKSTTQILREMSEAWEDMTDIERASALELMGGKRQANILASVITNFETVEDVITTSMNSAGSAMAENEKWLDSIEGKTYQFTNALQTMWNNMLDAEVIKGFLDFGTEAIKILDTGAGKAIAFVAALKLMAKFKGFSIKGVAQGLSDTINKVTTAQRTLEALSQTTKVGKGYDFTNVNAYAAAVANLTAKQQANLLASQGLSQEQIKYAMTLNQVSGEEIKAAMAQGHASFAKREALTVEQQLNMQKNMAIVTSLREQAQTVSETNKVKLLAVANQILEHSSEELTEAKLKELMVTQELNEEIQEETIKKASNAASSVASSVTKTGGFFATIGAGISALWKSNPVGLIISVASAVLSLIPLLSSVADTFIKSAEEIKQEAGEIAQAYSDVVNEVNSHLQTLGATDVSSTTELEKEFATLTAGVDKYGNNLSLTSDQYERYKEICEQIVGINPRIAFGYDSATEAIGNNASALSGLIELQKEQARLAAEKYVNDESLDVLAKDAVNDYKDAKKDSGASKVENKEDLFGMLTQGTSKETMEYILRTLGYSEADIANKIQEYYLSDVHDYDSFSFISDFIDEIEENTSKFDGYTTKLDDFFLEYEKALKSGEDGIKAAQDGLIDTLMIVPKSSANYDKLTSEGKNFLTDWIQNSDIFKVDESTTEEDVQDMRDTILTMMNLLVSEAKTVKYNGEVLSAQDILNKIYNFDTSSVNYEYYKTQVNAMLQAFWNSLSQDQKDQYGFTDFESFKVSFGFDFEIEENQIETAKNQVAGFLNMSVTEIQRKLDGMSAAEIKAFYSIDWNAVGDDGVDTWQDVVEKIHGSISSDTVTVKTYSVLAESIESYNDILAQTSEMVTGNTEVTQEYKDSLIELGVSEEELKECFDDTNPLIVKNAKALNQLVKVANKNVASNIKLAKSQTRLEYYDLIKQLNGAMRSTKILDAATRDSIYSTLEQIDAVEKALYQYQLLEDTLLGVNNAFDKFAKAQEVDSLNTYGDSYVEMAQTMYDALYKTGQVGTEAFWSSVESLVPTEVYQHLTDDADRMKAIYDYYNKNILPSLRLDEDELSLDYSAIEEFVKKGLGSGVFSGDVENFDLVKGMNLEKAAELMGMTETQAYALFAELDKYNTAGNDHSFLSQLDDSLEGRITNITNDLEDLNRQKLALLEDGGYAKNKEAIDEINQKISQSETELNKLGQEAYNTWQAYTKNDAALAALDLIEDKQRKLTEKEANMLGIEWDKAKEMTVQQAYDTLLGKQLELEEPTILTAQLAIQNIDAQIAELQAKLDEAEKNPTQFPVAFGSDIETEKQKLRDEIKKLQEDKVVLSTTFGIELSEEEKKTLEEELNTIEQFKINDKEFTVVANGTSEVINLLKAVNDYAKDVTKTVTTEYKTVYTSENKQYSGWTHTPSSGGRYTMADGTAHVDGTAYKEGSWGAPKTETALVGELGPEMLVRNGRWTTVGDNGAEFTQVQKGDIIFNHKQTEDLLSKGYVTGRGKLKGGSAFASGTAYSGLWNPTSPNTSQSNKPGHDFTDVGNRLFDAADSLSGAAADISDSSDEFREVFDWVEVRLEEINEDLELRSAKLENAIGHADQNKMIVEMIKLNEKLYDNLEAGYNKYNAYAQKLLAKIPEKYREAAQNGSIALETFVGEVGEKTLEAIQDYREWAQKAADAKQQAEEVKTEISTLAKQAIDNIATDYENKASLRENKTNQLDAYNALLETTYGYESEEIYKSLIKINQTNISELQKQRNAMQKELDAQVKAGNIQKYSQDWYDAVNDIAAIDTEIIELQTDTKNYQDTINELHWDKFDDLLSRLEAVSSEAENLIDILSSKDLVDDSGNWTDEGITTLGLYAQQMENAEMQAKQYQEEIDYLNENWKELGYTEQEYLEKLEELKDGQYDAIKSYNDAKDAIVDLNKERVEAIKDGIQKEIDAYEELIEKKKEELDAEKDLYDFQKNIMEQEKDVAQLRRELAAISGDNSASARAKRAQLEAELAEAEADLKDSYYERSVSNRQDALDKELENFQEEKDKEMEGWDEYLENTEQVVADSLSTVQANTDAVYQTLKTMGQEYGLSISESLTSPWKDGEMAIQSYSEKFGLTISSTVEQLKALEEEFDALNEKIDTTGDKYADKVVDNTDKYTEAEYEKPKKEEPKKDTEKKEETKPSLTKGSYVEVKSGTKWYSDSYGAGPAGTAKSGKIKYINQDGSHPYNIDGLGWIKKKDIKGYAKGSNNISKDQLAWLDELGDELQLVPDGNGRLAYIKKGTGIIPADLTERLVDLAMNPQEMLDRNRPEIKLPSEISNTEIHIDNSVGELIHIDKCDQGTLPDVEKIVNKAIEKRDQKLNNALRKYAR